jgi:signal-transduction protein with cAMP-binding, CBS, and nucleotidyltransferase domain
VSLGLYFIEKGTVELYSASTKILYEKVNGFDYFGLDVLFTKTSRHWSSSITRSYADMTMLPR